MWKASLARASATKRAAVMSLPSADQPGVVVFHRQTAVVLGLANLACVLRLEHETAGDAPRARQAAGREIGSSRVSTKTAVRSLAAMYLRPSASVTVTPPSARQTGIPADIAARRCGPRRAAPRPAGCSCRRKARCSKGRAGGPCRPRRASDLGHVGDVHGRCHAGFGCDVQRSRDVADGKLAERAGVEHQRPAVRENLLELLGRQLGCLRGLPGHGLEDARRSIAASGIGHGQREQYRPGATQDWNPAHATPSQCCSVFLTAAHKLEQPSPRVNGSPLNSR